MQGLLLDSGGCLVRNDLQGVMFGECLEKYGGVSGLMLETTMQRKTIQAKLRNNLDHKLA